MFDKIKEKRRLEAEEKEQLMAEEKAHMLSMSEKELLIEILNELKRINKRIDDVESTIISNTFMK